MGADQSKAGKEGEERRDGREGREGETRREEVNNILRKKVGDMNIGEFVSALFIVNLILHIIHLIVARLTRK